MSIWYLYIIRCRDNSLYTGIATDVARRFTEHCTGNGRCARYLRGKGPLILAFVKKTGDRSLALKMEYRVKRLSKAEKERIVGNQRLPDSLRTVRRKKGAQKRDPRKITRKFQ